MKTLQNDLCLKSNARTVYRAWEQPLQPDAEGEQDEQAVAIPFDETNEIRR